VAVKSVIEAVREAIREEMQRDPSVFVMGEDVGARGGVFLATQGLIEEFGENRIIDTPLAEASIVGIALGAAFRGQRPMPEIQFSDFVWPSINQLIGEAARTCYGTNGAVQVPMTVRIPYGGGIRGGLFHSQNVETHFFHTPGLKVVTPCTPYDAKGLLKSAIRDNNPVVFFEDQILAALPDRFPVPEEEYVVPIGEANVKREGSDVTVVAISKMVPEALKAADELEAEGISLEVVDPRTLVPMDTPAIRRSVRKTGRAVIVDEACITGSAAAEISARITEDPETFRALKSPPVRVCAPDVPIPYSPVMEQYCLPDKDNVIAGVRRALQ
jgi:2-oxoisovalerate dehydrogenase E1 component beta subunit